MSRLRTYLAMYRVAFTAPSNLHANSTAEWLRQHIESTLDPGDTVDTTQVFAFGDDSAPDELINLLKKSRNELTRLKFRDTMNLAQQLDIVIWKLQSHVSADDDLAPNYDWNRIIEVAAALDRREDPLV